MEMIYVIILGAVYLGLVGLAFLVWAIKTGQFEDMEGPAQRILMDDDDPRIPRYADSRSKKQ